MITLLPVSCHEMDPFALGHAAVLTDPPYSEHVHANMRTASKRANTRKRTIDFESLTPEDIAHVTAAASAAPGWTAVYCDTLGIGAWLSALPRNIRQLPLAEDFELSRGLPWLRWSSPQQSDDRPPSGVEWLCLSHGPGTMRWQGPRNLVALSHKCLRGNKANKHPAEKPLDQALDLVAWFTNPGDLVYDPYAGWATFGLACRLLGREYLGCDQAPQHYEAGAARLAGDLSRRDVVRLERWLVSIGVPAEIAGAFGAVDALPQDFWTLEAGRWAGSSGL